MEPQKYNVKWLLVRVEGFVMLKNYLIHNLTKFNT